MQTDNRVSTFDPIAENKLIALVLRDVSFFMKIQHLVKPEYFREDIRPIVAAFMDHYKRYRLPLTDPTALTHAARVNKKLVRFIYQIPIKGADHNYYMDLFVNFCKTWELEKFVF